MGRCLLESMEKWCAEHRVILSDAGYVSRNGSDRVDALLLIPTKLCRGLVVYAHGTGNDHLFPQMSLFQSLASAGFAVFSFDLDGHGKKSTTSFNPEKLQLSIDRAVEVAASLLPTAPIFLIGQSLGGALVLKYLAEFPRKVLAAVLISVPLFIPQSGGTLLSEVRSLESPSFKIQIRRYGIWNMIPAFGWFKRRSYPIRLPAQTTGSSRPLHYLDDISRAFQELNVNAAATKVEQPILLIYGDLDKIAPTSQGSILEKNLKSSQLVVVKGETHFTTLFSETCEQSIIQWLGSHLIEVNQ